MSPSNNNMLNLRGQILLVIAAMSLFLIFTQGTVVWAAPKGLVDINTASQADLEAVKGIGPVTAKKIIDNRPYKSLAELNKVDLSSKQINDLKPLLTAKTAPAPAVSPAAPKAKKTAEPVSAQELKESPDQKPATIPKTEKAPKGKQEAPKLAPGQRVNLNTASQEDLEKLPSIGPTKAKAIIKGRPYKSPEDIMKVRGIKEGTYKKLKEFITVK